jgi:glycosyltransferase involved in cell wall biosynthesis
VIDRSSSSSISVCITTYNRADGLDRTLASLAAQTLLPDEIVVSDDCSADHTHKIAAKWQERFPRLRYFRNARNLRMPANLNAALRHARGTYIANLHDADTFAPTLIERWAAALDRYPSAGFVFSGVRGWPFPTREGAGVILHDVEPLTAGREFFERRLLHRFSSIVWGTVMARREAYEQTLPFDERFGFTSDIDMWMRMCLYYDVAYVREPLIVLDHPHHSGSPAEGKWSWVDVSRRIQLANIVRFYGSDRERLQQELRLHRRAAVRYLARRVVGRAWHRDGRGVRQGLALLRQSIRVPRIEDALTHV